MRLSHVVLACGAVLIAGHPAVVAQISLANRQGQSVAKNDLPVDILLHLYSPSGRAFSTLRVPAGAEVPVKFADAKKLSEEPITIQLSRRGIFRACTVGLSQRQDLAGLARQVKDLDFLETDSGKARINAASAEARLQLDQFYDEQNTFRNDPLRNELQRQQDRNLSTDLIQHRQQQEAVQGLVSDVTQMAFAWAEVQRERLNVLHDQFKTFGPLVQQARLALEIRETEFDDYRRTVLAWQEFSDAVARALETSAPRTSEQPIAGDVVKICNGPSGEWDSFRIDGPEREGHSVLIAEASFDHGEKQLTHLRRIGTTPQWTGRLDWPETSSSAGIRVRWPGTTRWYAMKGKVEVQRPPMKVSLEEARRASSAIEKNLKDTNFRAAGGDVIKTAPIF